MLLKTINPDILQGHGHRALFILYPLLFPLPSGERVRVRGIVNCPTPACLPAGRQDRGIHNIFLVELHPTPASFFA